MYCTECGTRNEDIEAVCTACGAPLLGPPLETSSEPGEPIKSYLVPAILSTLCCCVPFGIVAIVFAAGVDGKVAAGDVAGAREASRKAKLFAWISFGLGLTIWLVYLGFAVVGGLAGALE